MAKAASNAFKVLEHVSTQLGFGSNDKSILQREQEKRVRQKKEKARVKARQNLVALPDEKAMQVAARRSAARKRAIRAGRSSTILSNNQTLG